VSDVTGVSARAILDALLAGQTDPQVLAALAKGQLRKKTEQLQKALTGTLQPHHRILLVELLSQIDYLDEAIARLDSEIAAMMQPFQAQLAQLDSIPGVSQRVEFAKLCGARAFLRHFVTPPVT
jgi:transposase